MTSMGVARYPGSFHGSHPLCFASKSWWQTHVYIRQGCQERELRPEGKKHLVTLQQGNEHLKCAFEVQQNIRYIICRQHD